MNQEDINDIISKSTPEWRNRQILKERGGDHIAQLYWELIFAVHNKIPGETRHDTALRLIRKGQEIQVTQQGTQQVVKQEVNDCEAQRGG